MASTFFRKVANLDLEEKILNACVLISIIGIFLPWMSGRWLGEETRLHTGFGFYTSFIGIGVFLLDLYVLLITIVPLTSGTILVRKQHREVVRLCCTVIATVLIVAALTVLYNVTLEFQSMEVRFGVFVTLLGSLVASIYAFLGYQEQKRQQVHELFHHPDDTPPEQTAIEDLEPPPPPPPPPPAPSEPEQHPMHTT